MPMSTAVTAARARTERVGGRTGHPPRDCRGRRWAWGAVAALLTAFLGLAAWVGVQGALPFDAPLLHRMRAWHGGPLDEASRLVSALGHGWGVVPVDIALVLLLAAARRVREATFAAAALGGSGLLVVGLKRVFARERPSLWEPLASEHTFSFPSGHAMGSMTLAAVLVALAWPTRWRWPVAVGMGAFVLAVGASRVHLGVHYPSDVLAGWTCAVAWTLLVYLWVSGHVARGGRPGPWRRNRPGSA